jgi:serine/threonine protein kinase
MLVNLTCGRNPWKRASFDDSTFRAFMKDPTFLRTILPISLELDSLLQRIFEFNPAKRATIREIRETILRCSTFTASKSTVSSPLPSPPFSPVDYTRDAAFNTCYQGLTVPSMAQLPGPVYSPAPFQHSTSSGSTNSDNESVFSSCSSASSTSSTSSYHNVSPSPTHKFSTRVPQPTYVSPPPPANTWFQPFIQAANIVKHVSFQPSMMAQPVHVY